MGWDDDGEALEPPPLPSAEWPPRSVPAGVVPVPPGRRLETRLSASEHVRRTGFRISLDAAYPSPAALRAKRRGGRATVTFTMTLSRRLADAVLQSGRTLTVSATYCVVGAGARQVTLADEAGTTVEAVGARTTSGCRSSTPCPPTHACCDGRSGPSWRPWPAPSGSPRGVARCSPRHRGPAAAR